ncbi:MAG: hypothetical protein H8E36_14690 [Rhodospirillaceae bacterium]|nr:hypothetical protein [Rhodospirillaceae bacterium]
MRTLKLTALMVLASLSLGACAGQMGSALSPDPGKDDQKAPTQTSFARFPDLPMPVKAEMDMSKTLVFGTNDEWIGRLVISSSHGPNDMFDFYKQEMTGFGWQEITSVRSDTSVMTYTRGQRVATIQITSATLRGSKITITVSPKGAEEFPAPAIEGTAPPPAQ